MALVVAALALLSTLLSHWREAVETVSQYLSSSNFKLNAAVVELGMDQSTFAVTNVSDRSAVITSVQCGLYLPIDPRVHLDKALIKGVREQYRWKDTVGMFLVSFDPDEPFQIAANEQALVKFHTRHVSPAFGADRFGVTREPEELVSSYCSVVGLRGNNELVGGAFLLNPQNTSGLDALDVLQIADYSEQQEPEREALTKKILSARSASE